MTEDKSILPDTDINSLNNQLAVTKELLTDDLQAIKKPARALSWFSSVKTISLTETEAKNIGDHIKEHMGTANSLVEKCKEINKEHLELKASHDSLVESFNTEKKKNEELSATNNKLQFTAAHNKGYLEGLGAVLNDQGEIVRHNLMDEVKQATDIVNRAGQEIQTLQEEISSLKENISNLSKMTLREEGNTAAIFRRLESMPTKKDLGIIVNEAIQRHVEGLRQDLPREFLDQPGPFIAHNPAEEKKGIE